mgnify:FL=1
MMTCKNCGEVHFNEVEFIDHGIGAYEYGSIKVVDHNYQLTCKKCGGEVDNDWDPDKPCLDDGWER